MVQLFDMWRDSHGCSLNSVNVLIVVQESNFRARRIF